MENPKLLVPSWKESVTLLDNIVSTIRAEYRPEVIIGVSRGGLIPALLISDLLDIPNLGSTGVTFYKDIDEKSMNPTVVQPLNIDVEGKHILVVDDISDSGKSLTMIAEELKMKALEIRTATIYRKPATLFIPDYCASITDTGVVFPWEHIETAVKMGKRLLDSGMSLHTAIAYLESIGVRAELAKSCLSTIGGENNY